MIVLARPIISLLIIAEVASAQQLELSLDRIVDIHELGIFGLGSAEYDDETGRLWISGSGLLTGDLFEIDPLSGQVFSSFSSSVVPGVKHPAALAMDPLSGNLYLFANTDGVAGEVSVSGAVLKMILSHHITAAATDKNGRLYAYDHPALGLGDGAIHRVNKTTGEFENAITINGYSGTVSSMDFDPMSGNLFLYADNDDTLLEVDIVSGNVLSVTQLTEFLLAAEYPIFAPFPFTVFAAFAFNETGTQLYLSRSWDQFTSPYGGATLVVINREFPPCTAVARFEDLGNALPSASGVAPKLSGEDSQRPCTVQIMLQSPSATAGVLVVGFGQSLAPFKGGVMVPMVDLLVPNAFGANGTLLIDLFGGALVGMTLYFQVWFVDAFAPSGYSATNGLSMTVQ
jgi:hypothetical protein